MKGVVLIDGQSVVVVTGNEFGDFDLPSEAGIVALREAAADYYAKHLQRETVKHPDQRIKGVYFSRRGGNKAISASANPDKLKLFAKLKELIESSFVVGREDVQHLEKHPGVKQFWRLQNNAVLGGIPIKVGFLVEERASGKIYYNHDLSYVEIEKDPLSGISGEPQKEALPPSDNGLNRSIIPQPDVGSNESP
ncbi:hypothetical protein FACS1894216_22830 [Synergistales bacterium]|nr:hypothetical protein FACS1894216_22830 [Synergistales bacterium]